DPQRETRHDDRARNDDDALGCRLAIFVLAQHGAFWMICRRHRHAWAGERDASAGSTADPHGHRDREMTTLGTGEARGRAGAGGWVTGAESGSFAGAGGAVAAWRDAIGAGAGGSRSMAAGQIPRYQRACRRIAGL